MYSIVLDLPHVAVADQAIFHGYRIDTNKPNKTESLHYAYPALHDKIPKL